ncbi:protein FAM210A isoform X1 [Neodiprion lecontei]|uniref:Protein FAM210A isoform X1 n=1 Tax=Neodiprion lecontei TaxID=441921 RepID=A0A6J0B764_NEOLC|nr:protein FAM210A isoform X1 [Neodiprion lecontei]
MELFIGRACLRLVSSPVKLSRNLAHLQTSFPGYERRRCLPQGQKLGTSVFEMYCQPSLTQVYKTKQIERRNPCNITGFAQRRFFSNQPNKDCNTTSTPVQQLTVFQKMKRMTKDYWYVLIPVHVVTSAGWVLIFYVAAKNSVDVIWILEKLHVSEKYIEALRGSSAGFWAIVYALYKIFTPLRYMVTVGGTTLGIRYLRKMGYMKSKLRTTPTQKPQSAEQSVSEHKKSYGKVGCKDGQTQADPPKT